MRIRWSNPRSAANYMGERNEATDLVPIDRACQCGAEAVVGIVRILAELGLDPEGGIEVSGKARDHTAGKRVPLLVVKIAVEGMEVAVASEEFDARWTRHARDRRHRLGRAEMRKRREGDEQQKRAVHQIGRAHV